ncbi:MAG TPA: amino acid adenylation domain-containing protein, partial [Thermoanaerobaculia bacterium]|nr:amino acid adenylation domain-containing protein [Thermoanaerobaculia bacterium]
AGEATDPDYWTRHLRRTVRFADGLEALLAEPGLALLEVGPGRTLGSLARRHPGRLREMPVVSSLGHRDDASPDPAALLAAAGRLWTAGVALDWKAFYAGEERRRIPLPTYPFERVRHWIEAPPASGGAARGTLFVAAEEARPAVAAEPGAAGEGGEAPASETERRLAGIWREVLGAAAPGRDDDFFELGGDSLLGLQVVARLRRELGLSLEVRTLFEHPTLAGLAHALDERSGAAGAGGDEPNPRRPGGAQAPLSYAQRRLWFLDRLAPGGAEYNEAAVVAIDGPLDVPALRRALGALVERHEVLRTTVAAAGDEPVQVVAEPEDFLAGAGALLPLVDLGRLGSERTEALALRLAAERAGRSFVLDRGPLFRTLLVRRSPEEHAVAFTLHHLICDAWSMGVMVRELGALYGRARAGERPELPPLPLQYADFAHWQRRRLAGEELERQLGWWRRELEGAPGVLDLPADRPRPPVRSGRGARWRFSLPEALVAAIEGYRRREGVTLFMVLVAALDALLFRLTGEGDLCVGTPVAGRDRSELEGLVGFFANTLVLRTDLEEGTPFDGLIKRVRRRALGAFQHQELPFENLVESLAPERDLSRTPLFQVLFALQNVPRPDWRVPDLSLAPLPPEDRSAKFDLSLYAAEADGGVVCVLEYATDLFDGTTVRRLAGQLERLTAAALAEAGRPVAELPLLSAAERWQTVAEWNDTAAAYGGPGTLPERLAEQARRTPEAVAVVSEGGVLSYGELARRTARLAARLSAEGVGPEARVGVLMERSAELVVALLGTVEAGAAYVPLDPSYPAERLAYMAADAGLAAVVAQRRLLERLPLAEGLPVLALDGPEDLPYSRSEDFSSCRSERSEAESRNLAYAIYTSGSTGRPKGAGVSHAAIVNRLAWMQEAYGLTGADAVVQKTPYSFDVSVWELFWPLLVGARLVVARPEGHRDGAYLAELVARERVTTMHFVPSMLQAFVEEPRLPGLSSLRRVIASGEALAPELAERFLSRSGAELHNLYGPTEAAVDVTAWRCRPGEASVPIGRPIGNLRIHVLDARGRPVPPGVAGELRIAGAGLGRGYLGRPGLTAERFVPDPFAGLPGERQYLTGDLVRRRPDGALEFLGRLDHQVKVRGFRIELGEIETALAAREGVREAVVVARPGVGGAGDARLVAYVVPAPGCAPDPEDLSAALTERLPGYMVPSAFVVLDELPLTPSGKVDRKALPEPAPRGARGTVVAPRTPAEELLAGIWSEVLGIDRVGVEEDFFRLGGHSLLAPRVVSRVRQAFGVELPLRLLFEEPTVARLARRLESAARAEQPPLVPLPRRAPAARPEDPVVSGPLSFGQERLWLLDRLAPGSAAYNMPFALRLRGTLDAPALAASLSGGVARHESLRTRFVEGEVGPLQVVEAPRPAPLPVADLSRLAPGAREAEARRLALREAARPFDLARGPVVRSLLVRLGGEDHLLAGTVHHAVSDGWSVGVLVRELAALYRGEELPELPVQYPDFAVWQRGWLSGAALAREVAWWREALAGAPRALELPADRPRPPVQSHRGAVVPVRLPAPLAEELAAFARERGATLFMALLAAFQALLARLTGQDDLLVGSPVAGRNRVETEGLVGFFVNTLVLRGDLRGEPTFEELLGRVRRATLGVYGHQDLPFEKLVEELAPERDPSRAPLVQVLFVLQNAPVEALELPGLDVSLPETGFRQAKLDLGLYAAETGDGLDCFLEYAADLFDRTTVERLGRHLVGLTRAALAAGRRPVAELPLLSPAERWQAVAEWNDTAAAYGGPETLPERLAAQARRSPEAVAVVSEGGVLTSGELSRRTARLAARPPAAGVGPEARVGVLMERSAELVVALLGTVEAGAAYVPLDPSYPAERLAYMAEDAGLSAVVAQRRLLERLPLAEGLPVLPLDGPEDLSPCRSERSEAESR